MAEMDQESATTDRSAAFIDRWSDSGAAERANYQLFLSELCDLLDVPRPDPATPDDERNAYVFERRVTFHDGIHGETSSGFIDLYRRGAFVCEAKQGSDAPDQDKPLSTHARALKQKLRKGTAQRGTAAWDNAMFRAKGQGEQYIRALPASEGRPPFLLVVDVGHSIECYAEFSCTGGTYLPYPAPGTHRILLADLEYPHIRDQLRSIWLEPLALDPSRRSARVTREIADRLARLAVSLEKAGHSAEVVAGFLMRCLFTMFAEDVNLLGRGAFSRLLRSLSDTPEHFAPMVEELWQRMDRGGFSTSLRLNILQFNGGLFADSTALPLTRDQLLLLIEAAACDWGDVEPAIFGTLLERALDPVERHKLGAHYTPRAYVERLVVPTIIEPVRSEWESVHAAAILHATEGDLKKAIAELVLWIGTLQWHFRTRGKVMPPQPIIRDFHNIECRDALIVYDGVEPVTAPAGQPQTRWDGRTTKPHPVTGREVPDETARVPVVRYLNPKPAPWPKTDYIVGNPPFIGPAAMRQALGDGYTEAVRKTHTDVSESSDFVMYWWNHAAELARTGKVQRFGFVTTNSLRQTFNRRVIERHLNAQPPLSLLFAIPDHPWVDAADGAAVRIAMTTASGGEHPGLLAKVIQEKESPGDGYDVELEERMGVIHADLTTGANVAGVSTLSANVAISYRGVTFMGSGFVIDSTKAKEFTLCDESHRAFIKSIINGKDITASPRDMYAIDFLGMEIEEVAASCPELYQWLLLTVKPERDNSQRKSYRESWWIFAEPRKEMRPAIAGLDRFIVTPMTAKHRFFVFVDGSVLPDQGCIVFAINDAYFLAVLSSLIHVTWALLSGGRLGVGNDPRYNNSRCFETFPFPDPTPDQEQRIRELGEQLDAHRKARQAAHPELTMTGMYNVLEKLRSGESLTAKERTIHEQGLVSVLKQLHEDLDAAVATAYGWPADLSDDEILERLVALNAERAREEANGQIRWLRPDFQNRGAASATQSDLQMTTATPSVGTTAKAKWEWPKTLPDQMRLLRQALSESSGPVDPKDIARLFRRAPAKKIEELLETLATLGHIRLRADGRYSG